jgi:hypothetical protein
MQSFSYSVWVKVMQSVGSFDMPMHKGGASAPTAGFDFELGTSQWRANVGDGTVNQPLTIINERLGAWVHLVAVIDRPANLLRVFADGSQTATMAIPFGAIDSSAPLSLGTNATGGNPFSGELDEPRVYSRALAPEWIAAEYRNLIAPAKFARVQPEEIATH